MANRKNYNSILFLTVYLGLVLVGGSSHVFAYAATNSIFDIRNEIEFKEDLDNKPDDEINDFLALEPEKAVAEFIEELKKLKQSGEHISNRQISVGCYHAWASEAEAMATMGPPRKGSSNASSALAKLWKRFETLLNRPYNNLPSFFKSFEDSGFTFNHKYVFSSRNLEARFNFFHGSPDDAKFFAEKLNNAFAEKSLNAKDRTTKITYENTKALSSNSYITVVINLPRGSIDSLLK